MVGHTRDAFPIHFSPHTEYRTSSPCVETRTTLLPPQSTAFSITANLLTLALLHAAVASAATARVRQRQSDPHWQLGRREEQPLAPLLRSAVVSRGQGDAHHRRRLSGAFIAKPPPLSPSLTLSFVVVDAVRVRVGALAPSLPLGNVLGVCTLGFQDGGQWAESQD
jgi:hypothetical protein